MTTDVSFRPPWKFLPLYLHSEDTVIDKTLVKTPKVIQSPM